jgi:minor fimbrial subunit
VTRRFINMVVIPRATMFRVYVTTTSSDPLTTPVYTISYSGTIQVPQSCAINAGNVVEFDFGDIGASLFSKAGVGNKPEGVSSQSKTIAIKCTNVEANAMLTMRVEAEKSLIMCWCRITRMWGSSLPTRAGAADAQQPDEQNSVPSRRQRAGAGGDPVWPVSVTGNKPAEGRFTSRGYLRVDYD